MKIDRLIGILSVLLQKEKTTAPKLAEQFEVSRRTINRDIETLCKAGIPIQTTQGAGGGICIMDGYAIDRSLLTSRDMQMIIAGLRSLDSVSGSRYYEQLMEKISPGASKLLCGRDTILIDLSSWDKESVEQKIALLQDAIERSCKVSFRYYAPGGESSRRIDPYYLIFKWSSWYVYGWCEMRQDFRLFKLNRMAEISREEHTFVPRQTVPPDLSAEKVFPGNIQVEAVFSPKVKWRVIEDYGPDCFREDEKGRLLFHGCFADLDGLVSWLLTFGDQVIVTGPEKVRNELCKRADNIVRNYGGFRQKGEGFEK